MNLLFKRYIFHRLPENVSHEHVYIESCEMNAKIQAYIAFA